MLEFLRLLLYLYWSEEIIQKKSKQGEGVKDMEFLGYWRKNMWEIQGAIKKVEFPGLLKKNSFEISMGLGFWPWIGISQGV